MEDPVSRTVTSYDRIAPIFAARTNDLDEGFLAFRRRFAAAVPTGGRVADLGCGPGRDAAWLLERGLTVVGVDRSVEMARLAAARGVPAVLGERWFAHRDPDALRGALESAGFEVVEHGLSRGHRIWFSVLARRREV